MLDYRPVGLLLSTERERELSLPSGRPLSYLRVDDQRQGTATLARTLLEERATELRRRVALVFPRTEMREGLATALRRFGVSAVVPLLEGMDEENGSPLDVFWLDRVQLIAFARERGGGLRQRDGAAAVGGLRLRPTYRLDPAGGATEAVDDSCQYWNSDWVFATMPSGADEWWRVRPNNRRERDGPLGFGRGSAARGTSTACVPSGTLPALGNPRYLVIEHPFRSGNVPVLAIEDEGLDGVGVTRAGETASRPTLYLDRTARDALGISDGEFCLVHPWLKPRSAVWRRSLRDRYVGSRAISANVRTSARADLEKPVCRLDEESLAAIGGSPGEFVTLETLRCEEREDGETATHWKRRLISQRVIPIDGGERSRRGAWEAGHPWDDGSVSPASWERRASGLEHEGFVDCAETLGVHPAYPTVYLNFHTRSELALKLCQPVEIRVNVLSRVMTEFGNLAWLVLIGLIGTVAALLDLSIGLIAAILAVTLVALLVIRAIRTIR